MLDTVVIGAALGGLLTITRWWRLRARESRSRERLAAILVHEEMTAAIRTLDLALREDDARWLVSMSESATLAEVWREHGQSLVGLGSTQWAGLDEAVGAMTPRHALSALGTDTDTQRRSLIETRRRLIEAVGILRRVLDQRLDLWAG